MKFEVAYRKADGKMAETVVDVANRNAVYSELRRLGITPVSLHEVSDKKHRGEPGVVVRVVKFVVMLVLLAVAGLAVWYFFIADDSAKQRVRNLVTPSSQVDMQKQRQKQNPGPAAPRKGTGAVSVRISE